MLRLIDICLFEKQRAVSALFDSPSFPTCLYRRSLLVFTKTLSPLTRPSPLGISHPVRRKIVHSRPLPSPRAGSQQPSRPLQRLTNGALVLIEFHPYHQSPSAILSHPSLTPPHSHPSQAPTSPPSAPPAETSPPPSSQPHAISPLADLHPPTPP